MGFVPDRTRVACPERNVMPSGAGLALLDASICSRAAKARGGWGVGMRRSVRTCGRVSGDRIVPVGRLRARAPNGRRAIPLIRRPRSGRRTRFLCRLPIERKSTPRMSPSSRRPARGLGGPRGRPRVPAAPRSAGRDGGARRAHGRGARRGRESPFEIEFRARPDRQRDGRGGARAPRATSARVATWLILPVVICLSQRLSHACVSMN